MRWQALVATFALLVGTTIAACGSDEASTFPDGSGGDGGANAGDPNGDPPPGTFAPRDDAGSPECKPRTCAEANANCGPIGDGCGGLVQCGDACPEGETCGGGGAPSLCGKPTCTPKTCADLDVECGEAGDGCGNLISCGTCEAGTCGGGGPSKCGVAEVDAGACVPTKLACAPGDCGLMFDGCSYALDCTMQGCAAGETCGALVPDKCGVPACVKDTCGAATCGFKADGCGGSLNCWPAGMPAVCGPGETCGGGGVENQCGIPAGCVGLCQQQQVCPGGGTTSIEGYVTSPNGLLPVPNAIVYVPNGPVAPIAPGVTCEGCAEASGNPLVSTTTDANGHFLLPKMPVSIPGKVMDIPVVVQLGRWRKQFTIQTTACENNLVPHVAAGVPANKTAALPSTQAEGNIPLTAISTGSVDGLECVFRKMGVKDSEFSDGNGNGRIRLYQDNGARISAASPKAEDLYGKYRSGSIATATNANPIVITSNGHGLSTGDRVTITGVKGNTAANGTWTVTKLGNDTFSLNGSVGNAKPTANSGRWTSNTCAGASCTSEIDKFDAVIFGCTGAEQNKGPGARDNVIRYANTGGRVFATHYSYVWLHSANGYTSPWASTVTSFAPSTRAWSSTSAPGSLSAFVDTTFPKGVLFSNWLQAPVGPAAAYPPPYPPVNALWQKPPGAPMIALTEPRQDIKPSSNFLTSGVVAPAQRWVYTTAADSKVFAPGKACTKNGDCGLLFGTCLANGVCEGTGDPKAADAPMHYTFNTPWGAPAANQCGRVLFSDFHVSIGTTTDKIFPAECNDSPLTAQEKVLAYMLFDLASCVSTSEPPACVPKTCAEQGLGCGLAGDGCGNPLNCGNCPNGETCGGGGLPSQCGAPACAPKVCAVGQCGKMGNGCGGQLDCGECESGTCGGGGANMCGAGPCAPTACPAPAEGSACGPVANGCGGVNACACPAGMPCVNGKCGAPQCTPRTCQQAGANCGKVPDGCGKILECGTCIAPQTCGGSGHENLCGGGVN